MMGIFGYKQENKNEINENGTKEELLMPTRLVYKSIRKKKVGCINNNLINTKNMCKNANDVFLFLFCFLLLFFFTRNTINIDDILCGENSQCTHFFFFFCFLWKFNKASVHHILYTFLISFMSVKKSSLFYQ